MFRICLRATLLGILFIAICGFAWATHASLGDASPGNAVRDDGKSLVFAPAPASANVTGPCDRDCLYAFVDKYFDALISRCPCGVAMAPAVKYTENGQVVKPGEGIWKTIARRGTYRVYLADPANGTVGYYGDFSEDQGLLIGVMALRLKVQDRRITEVEMIVNREQLRPGSGGLGANTAGVMTPRAINELQPKGFISPDAALLEPVPAAARLPREQLVAISDRYFEAFAQSKSSIAPFADGCSRRENGIAATNNSDGPPVDPAQPAFRVFSESCAQEIDRGFLSALAKVRNHRQLVVDEEQGLVLDLALLDNPGNVKSVSVPGVGNVTVPQTLLRPITYLAPELFKIENGTIRQIEGLAWPVPYGMRSGWDN
jgi:hypothetical protein